MHPRQLLEENVALVDRLAARACRRVGIAPDQADDVASMVKVQLMENDYAILRRWEGRSSLATYLTIVVQRLLADQHERTHGRWRPSPEAQRLGETAVLIEDLVSRQGRSIDESLPLVRAADASMTHEQVAAIADRLPRRAPRPREVELPLAGEVPLPAADRTDGRALDRELSETAARTGALLRETMEKWAADDRLLVRLRFESSLSIADIARVLNAEQRPLYRRLEALLRRLREALLLAGIDEAAADELVSAGSRIDVDLGLAWKNDGSRRTTEASGRASPEERS